MILRPYQKRVLREAWDALHRKLNVLVTAPCSAGKTILFSKIIQRLLAENKGVRCLILVDREILVSQSADKLRLVAPELSLSIGIMCASVIPNKQGGMPVTIASRQSLANNLNSFSPINLCIVDEAHLMGIPRSDAQRPDQWSKIINCLRQYNPSMRLLGCTASPYRLGSGYIYGDKNKESLKPYWDKVDAKITTQELLREGYVAPTVGLVRVGDGLEKDLSNIDMVSGEYNLGQLSDVMCREVHVRSCVDAWKEHASDRKKTLVFCTSISHANEVSDAFKSAYIKACAIHSKIPQIELAMSMHSLKTGEDKVFCSVAKLTTGMDTPDIDCIIIARPTKSAALYQQIVGRGGRIAPGKDDCLVIDLVGVSKEFGTDMDNLNVVVPRESPGGEFPMKICAGEHSDGSFCGVSVHAAMLYCPACGYKFPSATASDITAASVGELKKIEFNTPPDPEWWNVSFVSYHPHKSKQTGKTLIKISYECSNTLCFDEYLCLPDHYSGFAVDRAQEWWAKRSSEAFPETVEEFLFLAETLPHPSSVAVIPDGKFEKIVGFEFEKNEGVGHTDPASGIQSWGNDIPF